MRGLRGLREIIVSIEASSYLENGNTFNSIEGRGLLLHRENWSFLLDLNNQERYFIRGLRKIIDLIEPSWYIEKEKSQICLIRSRVVVAWR